MNSQSKNFDIFQRVLEIRDKESRIAVGLMSGTSADGVDVVVVELIKDPERGVRLNRTICSHVFEYPNEIKKYIFEVFEKGSTKDVALLNFVLGEVFGIATNKGIDDCGLNRNEVDFVSSHGQTVYHIPQLLKINGISTRATLQIGEISVIAEKTGLITVGDFRVRDVASGGQGAPIVSYVDYIFFKDPKLTRLVQNIVGISNVTVIPANARVEDIYGFDTGPGNMMVDAAVRIITNGKMEFDYNGEIAYSGDVKEELLSYLLSNPYIKLPPPKTTGRETFGEHYTRELVKEWLGKGYRPEDIVTTLTEFTVRSILLNYKLFIFSRYKVDEVIVGGEGSFNKYIMNRLKEELGKLGVKVSTHEDYGISSKFKEAIAMAILGNETIEGRPNNVPNVTGAYKRVIMGKVVY
ncbi:MAG: anhydro-N-acetylmuramic acid kinase [Sulfolobus sp.]|nr:anhydro-N-acetylmuramic acid kinase [Sulfolobus sp.]